MAVIITKTYEIVPENRKYSKKSVCLTGFLHMNQLILKKWIRKIKQNLTGNPHNTIIIMLSQKKAFNLTNLCLRVAGHKCRSSQRATQK